MTAGEPASGVSAYGEFVKDELAAQDQRKTSFEQRGIAVITTSGALATLLFGLAVLSTKPGQTVELPAGARDWLIGALVCFGLAAIAAVVTNLPLTYEAVQADEIKSRLKEDPPRNAERAAKDVALTRVKALDSAKRKNGFKGWALVVGMGFEAAAVACVAVAIAIVL